ncbi:MAG: hypothetical protein O2976_06105 [Actinomycetota bacterium]|nr:hypothetical protein [Actinomycetota bacterium]
MPPLRRFSAVAIATALMVLGVIAGSASAAIPTATAGQTEQATSSRGLDQASGTSWGWSNTTFGVAGRPYIKALSVSNDGGATFTDLVVADSATAGNGWAPTAASIGGQVSDVYAFITPTNGCREGQAPVVGSCYAQPNRVGISLMRYDGAGWDQNFTTGASTNPAITENSVIDLAVGFHSEYSTLRWSWVNGVPSYWQTTVSPSADGVARIRYSPKTMPFMTGGGGCSQIPVNTCDIAQADSEQLEAALLLSMDNTLDASLSGALFGTTSAFIGSLEAQIVQGQAPVLTYGVAAPHNFANGTLRNGTFYAFLPQAVLTLFGTSGGAFDPAILSVTRTGGDGTFTPAWASWTAGANGMDGQFLTISNISFSAPRFVVQRRGSEGRAAIKVGKKATLKQIAGLLKMSTKGVKISAKVSTPKICKVVGQSVKGLKVGTCKGTLTTTRKNGKPIKKRFAIAVTKAG